MNGFIAVSGQWKKEKASTPGGDEASTVTKEASIGGGACGTDHFLLARGAVDVDTDDLGAVEGLFGVLQSDDLVVGAVLIDEELEGVHALLGGEATEDELSVGEIRVDVAAHRAFVGSRELQLTTREFELLRVLVRAGGKVVSGEDILKEVWGEDPTGSPQTLQMHVTWLRRKLGDDEERPALLLAQEDGYLLTAG